MKKTYLLLFVSSLIFFIAGFYTYQLFFELVVPKNENLQIVVTHLSAEFGRHIYYSLFFSLVPPALYFTWKLCKIDNIQKKILITLIMLVSTIVALLLRIFMINQVADFVLDDRIINTISIESLRYTQFMLGGLLIGSLLSWIIFRQKPMKEKLPAAHE